MAGLFFWGFGGQSAGRRVNVALATAGVPMSADDKKRRAAEAAMSQLRGATIIGVGTGSTVNHLIDLMAKQRDRIEGAVSSSAASTARLIAAGIPVLELNST